MLVKLEELVKSKKSFDSLITKNGIPFKQSYALSKLHQIIQKEVDIFEKLRNDKIKECSTALEDGSYQISKELFPKFQQDLQEVLDVEIDIPSEPIKVEIFENCNLEPIVFSDLNWLITD